MGRAKTIPWMRLDITVFKSEEVIVGQCGAAWVWALVQLKRNGGRCSDLNLHPRVLATDLSISVENATRQIEGCKAMGLLVLDGDEWVTPNWAKYQPDPRRNSRSRKSKTDADTAGPDSSRAADGTGRDATGTVAQSEPDEGVGPRASRARVCGHTRPDGRRLTVDNDDDVIATPPAGLRGRAREGTSGEQGRDWGQQAAVPDDPIEMEETPFGPRPIGAPPIGSSSMDPGMVRVLEAFMSAKGVTRVGDFDRERLGTCFMRDGETAVVEAIGEVSSSLGRKFDARAVQALLIKRGEAARASRSMSRDSGDVDSVWDEIDDEQVEAVNRRWRS